MPVTNSAAQSQTPSGPDDVLDRNDPRWARLRDIILEKSLKFGDFILSSKRPSKYLFQLRQTTMLPEGASLLGDIIVEYMQRNGIGSVGGLEMGAVPIVAATAVASHRKGYAAETFFVRKAAKEHGAKERIDGHLTDGHEVLLVDDVATSGQSMFGAIEGIHREYPNCHMKKALVVIDRQEGATEALADRGIQLVSVFKKSDFPIPA
jgi:orotate phosphoribosyltransferase